MKVVREGNSLRRRKNVWTKESFEELRREMRKASREETREDGMNKVDLDILCIHHVCLS